jgi:23S rRNA (adenine2503-C2)-methyltransferase
VTIIEKGKMQKRTGLIITKNIEVPTGNIVCCKGSKGELEFVSVGDYGKKVNLKADFLGLTNAPTPFKHVDMLPLTDKWVITISTQYGCSINCKFCDVPKVGRGKNATLNDMIGQILSGLMLHPEIESSKRLNVHFARMGEPSFNPDVLDCAKWLKEHIDHEYKVHPVISTMMPKHNKWLRTFIHTWMRIKNRIYKGNAGLQLSINSTNETERVEMFSGNALRLAEIAKIMERITPIGRKITLNFAVADYEIDPQILLDFFSPDHYLIKLTPMHKTNAAIGNKIKTNIKDDYTSYHPYDNHEKYLKNAGYDVIVFLASEYEDLGRITCGNAILSGSMPEIIHKILV